MGDGRQRELRDMFSSGSDQPSTSECTPMSAVSHTRPETTGNSPRNGGHMNYVELPDAVRRLYPWPGQYLSLADRQRMHFIDEGQGETVLMLHGNPTWSFYYRNLIRALSV